jgi:hypothetical protein
MLQEVMDELKPLSLQYRVPQVALMGAPFIAKHYAPASFVWPPLGNLDAFAPYIATVVIVLCSLLPGWAKTKAKTRSLGLAAMVVAVASAILYIVLAANYVIAVDTPHDGRQIRSVGFFVEPRIRALVPEKNSEQLLMFGGLEEWQIKTVWTPNSVLALRLCLLATLAATLGAANAAFAAAARTNRRNG